MKVLQQFFKFGALALSMICCNLVMAQTQVDIQSDGRAERVEDRREQISENRDARQDNRQDRRANRDGLGERIGNAIQTATSDDDNLDKFIATCLLIGNQEEVALAQEAVQRAQNENVKQFAQMLVDDHQKAIQKLQQHAKQGMSLDGASDVTVSAQADGSNQYAANQSPTAQQYTANRADLDRDMADSGTVDKILKMHQQAAQECLSMTKSMMQEKQGAEFDKAFAGSQIGAHVGMLAKLKASSQNASPELAAIIQESEQSVQKHLEHAKMLCKELESMQASNR